MGKTARVELITHGHIVGTVEHDMVLRDLCGQRRIVEHCIDKGKLNVRVDSRQCVARRNHFRFANSRIAVQRLAL
ncbi:hypothetical protein D3C71_958190 [compost metagenome]